MLIDSKDESNIQIAIVEEKRLLNFFFESNENNSNVGNIYLGKVDHVENSLQAYFIDYGENKNGFMSFSSSKESLKKGQFVVVQVVKDEKENKGAMLTTFVEIKSLFMIILMNQEGGCSISKKISSKSEREIIKKWYDKLICNSDYNVIFRQSAVGMKYEGIKNDFETLSKKIQLIFDSAKKRHIHMILQSPTLIEKVFIDYYKSDTKLIVEGTTHDCIQNYAIGHKETESIFKFYNIEDQIESIYYDRVNLQSGGYIIIQHTEALTSIDVNSGICKKENSIDKTAFLNNIEAAYEIAKQIQLRDIGGLIVVDFIDMYNKEHLKSVLSEFAKHMENDKARYNLGEMDQFCLFTMSRQQLRRNSFFSLHKKCVQCNGSGFIKKDSLNAGFLFRQISHIHHQFNSSKIIIRCNQDMVYYILNHKKSMLQRLEQDHNLDIKFEFATESSLRIFYEQDNQLIEYTNNDVKSRIYDGSFRLPKVSVSNSSNANKDIIKNEIDIERQKIKETLELHENNIQLRISHQEYPFNRSFRPIEAISINGIVVGYLQ